MIAYVDSSVLLRVALGQPDALPEWHEIERGVSSALILTECLRTLDRIRMQYPCTDAQIARRRATILDLVDALDLVEIDAAVLDRAAQPMPTELGTLDAIHLATALLWREEAGVAPVMTTHDVALGVAARAHGLTVLGT